MKDYTPIDEALTTHLLSVVTVYIEHEGVSINVAGKRAKNGDATFFIRLMDGSSYTVKTLREVLQWFSDNWPEGAKWPDLPPIHFTRPPPGSR